MIINMCARCLDTGKYSERVQVPDGFVLDGILVKKDEFILVIKKCDWCDKGKEL